MTVEEYREHTKRAKYGNTKIEIDGWEFDSLAEGERYKQLKLIQLSGQIEDLTCHPTYELQPAFRDQRGVKHRAITYEADFRYTEFRTGGPQVGIDVVEDVKGARTKEFRLKEKLFRFRYPHFDLRLIEVGDTQ
jgi:hypothetical protein